MSQIRNQNYPNGLNPLNYMGVNAANPAPQVIQSTQAPLPTNTNFPIGTQWAVTTLSGLQYWVLLNLDGNVATWVQIFPGGGGGGGASEFPTDDGTADEVGGVLQVKGDGENISTEGSGNLVNVVLSENITVSTITVDSFGVGVVTSNGAGLLSSVDPLPIALGGTNAISMAAPDGVVYYDGTRLATTASAGTVGQVLTSNGPGMAPTFQPSGGGGGGITALTANTGVAATTASIKLQGNNVITTNGASTSEIDFSLTNGTNGQVLIGGGTVPLWRSITAGTNITLTPGDNSLTIAASGTAPAAACAFFYYQPTRASNVLGTSTFYGLGATVVMTSLFDNTGGAVTPGNGAGTPLQFTAPATGLYYLSTEISTQYGSVVTSQLPSVQISITGNIATANNYFGYSQSAGSTQFPVYPGMMSGMFYMTAGDVAIFQVTRFTNGVLNAHVNGTAAFSTFASSQNTWISGYRVA
jgi:hypothetical protein